MGSGRIGKVKSLLLLIKDLTCSAWAKRYEFLWFVHGDLGALLWGFLFSCDLGRKPIVNLGDVTPTWNLKSPRWVWNVPMMQFDHWSSVARRDRTSINAWDRFNQADFKDTILALAYMREIPWPAGLSRYFVRPCMNCRFVLSALVVLVDTTMRVVRSLSGWHKEIMERDLEETNDKNKKKMKADESTGR